LGGLVGVCRAFQVEKKEAKGREDLFKFVGASRLKSAAWRRGHWNRQEGP